MRLKQTACGAAKFLFHAIVFTVVIFYVINVNTSQDASTSTISRNLEYVNGKYTGQNNDLSAQQTNSTQCERKNEIVYIKTHKTGSCTVVNMLYRVALKYNIPVLLFQTMPYPMHGIDKEQQHHTRNSMTKCLPAHRRQCYALVTLFSDMMETFFQQCVFSSRYYMHGHKFLWEGKEEKIPTQFQMAAEHMRYERENLDQVITGTPLYTTTVRKPLDHLKSVFNYFDMAGKFNIPNKFSDPAIEYIRNKDQYTIAGKRKGYHIANGISNMMGLPDKDMYDDAKVEEFINKISDEFGLLMVTEYMAESFVLLRRKMCWDMTDVLYVSINVRKYKGKKPVDDPEIVRLHQKWNNVDYALYDMANQTLWKTIESMGSDFMDEVQLYKEYNNQIADYCGGIIEKLRNEPAVISTLYKEMKPLTLDDSKWSTAVTIDPVWCAAALIDIMPFYNILRVKQFPQICNYLSHDPTLKPHMFRIHDDEKKVDMVPDYCVDNPENTLIPLDILATKGIYSWS